jgi:hypothetical protein
VWLVTKLNYKKQSIMSSEDILREDVPRESGSESDKDSIASLDEETTKEDKNAQE